MEKESRKNYDALKLALVIIVGMLIIGFLLFLVFTYQEEEIQDSSSIEENAQQVNDYLPTSTEELLDLYGEIAFANDSLDRINFSFNMNVSSGDEVSVYVYSSPKLVGNFKVQEETGNLYIDGLESILKTMNLEAGMHHLVLVLDEQILGYVEITIPEEFKTEVNEENPNNENSDENNSSNENTTNMKTETKIETENISYSTEEVSEVNMKRGERRVTQAGQVGKKEVTYQITYDESGKEISREKISEKIVVQPVNEKVLVGSSDYNINTDTYYFVSGHSCLSQDFDLETLECKGEKYSFSAINLKGTYYATCIGKFYTSTTPSECGAYGEKNLDNLFLLKDYDKEKYLLISDYKGNEMIFYAGLGDFSPVKITEEFCDTWRLACGSW